MNDLIKKDANIEVFNSLAKSVSFRRLQLFGASNEAVKEGKIPIAHFGIVEGAEIYDLSSSFNCLVLDWRPKAMRVGAEIVVIYDYDHEEFKKIVEESELPDSGCMFGVEFLLYIPVYGFVPYYLNSKSTRYEAPNFRANIGKVVEVKSIFVKGVKYSWHAPKVTVSNVPLDSMPTDEEVEAELKMFRNPESKMREMSEDSSRVR